MKDWLTRETPHKREALENASRHFDESDRLTVNTLESIYSQETSFGKKRGKRGSDGPAGDFQLKRKTAANLGLSTSPENDERFDVDNASAAAAKELKRLHEWVDVKKYLEDAGASSKSSDETREYVEKIGKYEEEFRKKSKANQKAKTDKPKKMKNPPKRGHWVTVKGQHIFIEDK